MKTADRKTKIWRKKLIIWTTGIVGALLISLFIILLLLPYVVNLEPVRQKIMATISRQIAGQAVFQKVDFSFFPRPRIVIQQARILIPEKASVVAQAIIIAPRIIPLLRGEVRIFLVKAENPIIALELPGILPGEKPVPFPFAIIQERLFPLLNLLETKAPQLTVEVEKGSLNLRVGKQPVFWFQEIQGRIALTPDQLRIDLTCKSNLGENISIGARIRSKDLNGDASIRVSDLAPQALLNYLAPAAGVSLRDSSGNLKMDLEIDRGKILRGKFEGSSPSLVFQLGEKKSSLQGITLSGAFSMEGNKATFSLAELNLKNPRTRFAGEFRVDLATPLYHLEFAGREMDVSPVREIITGWAGTIEPLQTIFDILREGNVPYVSFKTRGRSPADLGELKNISVQGNLAGGRIFLSESLTGLKDTNFDLRKVQGEVLISGGILEGKNLAGQWEKTSISQGSLKLGLKGKDAPFHLKVFADADLNPLPPFLKKILRNQAFSEEMDRFRELQGRARGGLTLGETLSAIRPTVEIQEMSFSSRYDRIPYPLRVASAQGAYDRETIAVRNLKGSIGQTSFEGVSSRIALGGAPRLALSSGNLSIVLEEFFPLLASLESFKSPLQDLKSLKGNMTLSSLSLSGPLTQPEKWDYRLEGEIGNLTGRYAPIPYPLQVEKARGSFDGKKLSIQDLAGAIGKSVFSDISAQIDLGESPYITILSGKSSFVLEEILPWLTASERLKSSLQNIKSLNGVVALSSIALKGSFLQPEKWDYRFEGNIEKLSLRASAIPGPLGITAAKFEADPERILLKESRVNFLDAALEGSASGNGWQQGLRGFEATFRGDLGVRAVEWASARHPLPEGTGLRAPFSISQAHVGWDRAKGISFNGNCQWPNGPGASLDLFYTPEAVMVNRLLVADDRSRADIGVKLRQRELLLDFRGNLERTTVDRILVRNQLPEGSIRGDFQARIFLDEPLSSTVRGKLAGTGLRLALPTEPPLILHSFSLNADREKILVQSADLGLEERRLTAEGSIDLLPEAFRLDLNLAVDGLQWEKIEKLLKPGPGKTQTAANGQEGPKGERPSGEKRRFPSLQGRIGLKSPYFEYGKYIWRPLDAEIDLSREEVKVTVLEANVCGISTGGVVRITPGEVSLDFQPFAKNREFSADAACLLGRPLAMTGTYFFDGRVKGQGQPQDLIQSLKGPWQIEAKDGRFYHGSLVVEILSFLSLEELFVKDKKDLSKGEMSYKTLRAKGDLESGKIIIRELAFNTPEMQLFSQGEIDLVRGQVDLVVAVAPLKTVDWFVRHIPILGYILGGTLISIPVKVQGDLDDPVIFPLDPVEIGAGFLGIMKRTLNVPFKIIQPFFKDSQKAK